MGARTEFDWQPIDHAQVRAWASLVAAIEAVDHQDEHLSADDLAEYFTDPDIDYPQGSVAVYDGGTMIGFGLLLARTEANPVHSMRLEGGVRPAYRGRGVGSAILDWAERAAIPVHQARFPGHPLSLGARCLARNTEAVSLLTAAGYEPSRWFHRMSADLTAGIPDGPVPAGITIAGFTPERSEDARLVDDEAFRDHWDATETTPQTWAHFIGLNAFRPEYSFLAYAGAEPLGLVISHVYDSYTQATGRRDLYITTVATRRAGRKRGIATALLVRVLAAARADGFATATLDVDADSPTGALGLYQRLGFSALDTWITHKRPLIA